LFTSSYTSSWIFFIALFVDVSGAKTFSSCNCKARAVQRCVGKDSQDTCVKRYSRRCVRRCEQIKKSLPTCDCTRKSIDKCGIEGTALARDCRNKSIYRCLRKIEKKVSRSLKVHKLEEQPPKRELKEFSKKVAIKKCGKGAEHEECRRKVSTEVREREKNSEKQFWRHVTARQDFLKNAKMILKTRNAQKNTIDVQKDVWEEHAKFVQDLNVSAILIKPNAEDHQENLAKESTESKKKELLEKIKKLMK